MFLTKICFSSWTGENRISAAKISLWINIFSKFADPLGYSIHPFVMIPKAVNESINFGLTEIVLLDVSYQNRLVGTLKILEGMVKLCLGFV